MVERTKREQETRATEERPVSWKPPSLLPTPPEDEQYAYRWIRVASMGHSDNKNVSAKQREGWEPVRAQDYPEFSKGIVSDRKSEFEGNIEIGGLLLCRNSHENVKARRDYYGNLNRRQMESVEQNYLRENNPKMPVFSENKSRTTFGSGN